MNDHKNFSLSQKFQTILPNDMASRYSKNVLTTSLSELYIYTLDSVGTEQWPMPTEDNSTPSDATTLSPTKTSLDRDHRIYETRRYIYVLHLASPDQSITST